MIKPLLNMLHKSLAPAPAPPPVQIRIPADHPCVDALVRLFNVLATGGRTASGIIITGGGVSDEAERIFLRELEIFLKEDGVDLKPIIAPFFKQGGPELGLDVLMQRVVAATSGAPSLPANSDRRDRG